MRGEQAPHRLREQIRAAVLEQARVTVEPTPGGGTRTTVEVRSTEVRSTRIERSR